MPPRPRSRRDQVSALITAPFALWAVVRATGVGLGFPLIGAIALTPIMALLSPLAVVVALVLRARLRREAVARLDAAGARELFPGRVLEPRAGGAGGGLLARHALRPVSTAAVEGHEQPEATLVLPGGRELRIQAVHPISPISGDRVAQWRRQLDSLGSPHARDGTPRVLAGDFNATLDHRELRRLLERGFYDAADATGQGLHTTWPAAGPVLGLLTLDHVLLPPEIKVRSVTFHDIGSDHRAVIAELVVSQV